MKHDYQKLKNILYSPDHHVDKVKKAKKWLHSSDKELQQLEQKPNIYCNNCKDLSARNLLLEILGENCKHIHYIGYEGGWKCADCDLVKKREKTKLEL